MSLGPDAERSSQLAEEQPRSGPRRAVRHVVEKRTQRRNRRAAWVRRRGRTLFSGSAHCCER
eukprot:955239-Prymnesium_polylepis.1